MKFIQLGDEPGDGIADVDSYCFGLNVPDSEGRLDLYKFRKHPDSSQNRAKGWFCASARKTSFKLQIIFKGPT